MKNIIKKFFSVFSSSNFLLKIKQIIENNSYIKLDVLNHELIFFCPNILSKWRVQTIHSKEPETLEWIDNFNQKLSKSLLLELGKLGLLGIDTPEQYGGSELDKITDGPNIGQVLNHITHQRTVPNIFILGKHIGGYIELKQLHDDGELSSLLQSKSKYVCEFCGLESATNNLSCNCFPKQFGDWGEPL